MYTVTRNYETTMKLHWEDLSFIYTHSTISVSNMAHLIINANHQLNMIVYIWNCALKRCVEWDGFISLSSWYAIFSNSVMKLCTEMNLVRNWDYGPFGLASPRECARACETVNGWPGDGESTTTSCTSLPQDAKFSTSRRGGGGQEGMMYTSGPTLPYS